MRLQAYYGEQSLFYNPGGVAPLGVIFASLKENDGPNDRASRLSRAGVYRLAFQLTPDGFRARFGAVPRDRRVAAWWRWTPILRP